MRVVDERNNGVAAMVGVFWWMYNNCYAVPFNESITLIESDSLPPPLVLVVGDPSNWSTNGPLSQRMTSTNWTRHLGRLVSFARSFAINSS
jgi:hypothetical protein